MKDLFRGFGKCSAATGLRFKHLQKSARKFTSLALVAFFHNVNVLMIVLALLFAQNTTFLWKIVQVWSQKLQFV